MNRHFVQRSVGTHTGAHSLNQVGGQESDFGGSVSGLATSKKGVIPESYEGGDCAGSCPRTREGGRMFLSCQCFPESQVKFNNISSSDKKDFHLNPKPLLFVILIITYLELFDI